MRKPEFLAENGTIGFVAPSFGCATEPYTTSLKNAMVKLGKLGHQFDVGQNAFAAEGIGISNTPWACGQELTESYCSDRNDVIISVGGGELMCEILDYVDFEKIKAAKPKWYMGFSDNTNFTFLLNTICDVASIYAPCAATYGMEPWHPSVQDAYDVLRGRKNVVHGYPLWEREWLRDAEHPLLPYNCTVERVTKCFVPSGKEKENTLDGMVETSGAKFEGRLVGGCMDVLANLVGTNFDKVADFNERYCKEGIVWMLESCDLNIMSIRRVLWNMEHAGWFKYVKGFIIGRPLCFGEEMMGMDQYTAVTGILAKYNVPVIMDVDLGHLSPMMPMICGAHTKIEAQGNDVRVEFEYI